MLNHNVFHRTNILAKTKLVAQAFDTYAKCEQHAQLGMLHEGEAVHAAMFTCSATATHTANQGSSGNSLPSGGLGSGGTGVSVPVGSSAESSAAGEKQIFSNIETIDVFYAMQLYNSALLELDSYLLQYNAFCKQQLKKAHTIRVSVGELLKSTVKAFAYEQFRVWQDSATM